MTSPADPRDIVYCEPCGTILPPDATSCPVCAQAAAEFVAELAGAPVVHIRLVRCRYLRRDGNRCTAEALDADADIVLCAKHAARVLQLIQAGAA